MTKLETVGPENPRILISVTCKVFIPENDREEILTMALTYFDGEYSTFALHEGGLVPDTHKQSPREKRMRSYLSGKKVDLERREIGVLDSAIWNYRARYHSGYVKGKPPSIFDGLNGKR